MFPSSLAERQNTEVFCCRKTTARKSRILRVLEWFSYHCREAKTKVASNQSQQTEITQSTNQDLKHATRAKRG